MPRRRSFERHLATVLVLFSLVPSLLLLGVGTVLLSESVALQTSDAAYQPIAESGRELVELAGGSGDPALRAAAAEHRAALSTALVQAGRWAYLNERILRVLPLLSLLLSATLLWLAIRASRGIAREMVRPIHELVGWSARIARDEPLPSPAGDEGGRDEFAVLRRSFRTMERELSASRARALEAERSRAWVTMARTVAHELKNSLTPLRLGVSTLERVLGGSAAAHEPLQVVAAEAARLEELARAFSQFGRLPEGPVSDVDLGELLDYLLRTHLPPRVEGRLAAPVDRVVVAGHHEALSRAFANLLLNAVEAMGDAGGELRATIEPLPEGVEVRVRDSGPGIDPEYLERIWEPDFTTRTRGTGLGLALVRQAVRAHGGMVAARNADGGGAEFIVTLPTEGSSTSVPAGRPAAELA